MEQNLMHKDINISPTDAPVGDGYANYFEYLSDELKLLALRLRKELQFRHTTEGGERETRQIFISEAEVLSSLDHLLGLGAVHPAVAPEGQKDSLIAECIEAKAERLKNTKERDSFPLLRLSRIFGLTPFEIDIVMMALSVDLNPHYERIYGYFNDDLTKKAPTVGLALAGMHDTGKETMERLSLFSPQAPLFFFDLIRFIDGHESGSFLKRRFVLDERIRRFLVDDHGIPEGLSGRVKIYCPGVSRAGCAQQNPTKDTILNLLKSERLGHNSRSVFWLHGNARGEKRPVALAVCDELGIPLLSADLGDFFLEVDQNFMIRSLFREAALQSAAIFLSGGERLYDSEERSHRFMGILLRTLDTLSWITFISAEALWLPEDTTERCAWHPVKCQAPAYEDRRKIWKNALEGSSISDTDIAMLSGRFCFGEEQIRKVASYATHLSNGNGPSLDDVSRACVLQSRQRLSVYATKVTPHYGWGDIILPEDKMNQFREICSYVRYKHVVHFQWGFEKKMALGRGLNILFSGPSGTGKTMAADMIANELGLEMYKIDLSAVVSKYIGETEKNLSKIFSGAETSNALLFFDEADALFGKRSEVKDSHDRYANIETAYLLQRMEEYEGVVILATNFRKNMDEAFVRRLHFAVEFPFPNQPDRRRIWEKILPEETPRASDLDLDFLAGRFEISGGNIRNIALAAAFLAADEGSEVTNDHLLRATRREYLKMGKVNINVDFEPNLSY